MSNNELEALVNEWFQAFFGEDHIVYTMQAMMRNLHCVGHNYNKSSNDLCTLCITMANSKIVPALTDNGLTPFLNNYGYIILFKDMSNAQLQSLQNICLHMQKEKQNLFQPYSSNFYVIPILVNQRQIDTAFVLYAAAVLLNESLHQTRITDEGDVFYETVSKEVKQEYINSCLFKILHCSALRQGVMLRTLTLLKNNNVIL